MSGLISYLRFLFLLLLCHQSFAKNTWINVVGFVADPDLDYASFYEASSNFVEACKLRGLSLGTDCKVFSSRTDQKTSTDMTKASISKPDKKKVMQEIREAILNAKEGDQVVISLTNHGTVKKNGKSVESCIVLNESNGTTEFFCESDLKSILDSRSAESQKAKLFISAEGCMSGGFHNLGSSNVCTFAPAPKYNTTFGLRGSFLWQRAAKQKGVSLQELNDATSGFSSGFYAQEARVKFEMAGFRSESIRAVRCATNTRTPSTPSLRKEINNYRKKQAAAAQSSAFELYQTYFFDNLGKTRKLETLSTSSQIQNRCFRSDNVINSSFNNHLADLENIAAFLKQESISLQTICALQEVSKDELCQNQKLLSETQAIVTKHLGEINAAKKDYSTKLQQIIQMDELLLSQPKTDVVEHRRGELLEEAMKLESQINSRLRSIDSTFANSTLVLSRIHRLLDDKFCIRKMSSPDEDEENNEYLKQLKITPQTKYLDVSDKSLQEAENCEKSFLL